MTLKQNTTFAYYTVFVFLGMMMASTGPLLPSLAEQTGSQISAISILFSAVSLGRLMGALLGGRLFDKFNGHRVGIIILALTAAISIIMPFARILFILLFFYLVLGLFQAIVDVGTNTLIIWLHGDKVAPFMNALHLSFGVGAFLAPIIVAQIILATGAITWFFWLSALLVFPLMIWLSRLPSPQAEKDTVEAVKNSHDRTLIIMLACFFAFYVSAEAGFAGWIYTYALEAGLESETGAAYLTSAFFAAFTVGRVIAIPLASKIKPQTFLLADMIGATLSLGIMLLFPDTRVLIWFGNLMFGLSIASAFPTALAFAERRMNVTGQVTSYFFIGGSLGGIISPWVIGQLFDRVGPISILQVMMLVTIVALVILLIMIRYSSTSDKEGIALGKD